MGKRKVAALEKIDADFASLQYKARRDPRSYQDEIARQYEQYVSQREIFLAAPTTASADQCESFHDLIDLLAHVCDLYPDFLGEFPGEVRDILLQHHASLQTDLRDKMVGSLCMLRRKEVISSEALLTTLFPVLVSTPSKSLRALIFNKIVGDLRNANSKSTNHPLNRTIQDVLYNLVTSDRTSPKAVWAVKVVRELWKRRVWTDAKPVHVIKEACLADVEKVVVGGVRFFLGGDQEREEADDDSSDDDAVDLKKIQHQQGINKKTRKSKKAYDRAVDKVKRSEKKKHQVHPLNFSALHLLHDPQGFAEQLFAKHLQPSKSKLRLESKLLVLQLVSRLHGLHKLTIMPLFSWFTKHLMPRQESVSTFLACLAQSTHSLVPPDALEPLMLKIANEFVSEAAASEVAAAGLNAIREVCMRNSLAMNETLLQDLVQYRRSKDKGVMMAARGLLSLYRDVAPELLRTRDRGKDATINLRAGEFKKRQFGEEEAGTIEGLELLEKWKEEQRERKLADGADKADEDDDGFHSSEWEVDSDDSSESGDWINVSDDEDEAPASKRQRKEGSAEADDDKENAEAEAPRLSKLATTTILTPADLAKLQELRMAADVDKAMGGSRARRQKEMVERHVEDPVTAEQIELPAKLRRSTKEERIALAREGKPDREEHKSTQAIRKSKMAAEGKSTTNREKARRKNMLMTMGKAKAKQKRSLVETRKVLRGHVERSKRGGRRGNGT